MALVVDAAGTTHLVNIFEGGTFCGLSLHGLEAVDGRDPSCAECDDDGEDTSPPTKAAAREER